MSRPARSRPALAVSVVLAGALGAWFLFWTLVRFIADVQLLFVLALTLFGLSLMSAAGLLTPFAKPRRRDAALSVVTGLVVTALLGFWLHGRYFAPWDLPLHSSKTEDGVLFVDLETGSRLAYQVYPPVGSSADGHLERPAIVFLHGGPGLPEWPRSAMVEALNHAGFKVYAYQQFGAGLSSRAHRSHVEYTVERQVRDLEALRQILGEERWIPIGQSWGGALAAHYAASHPDRIASLILTAPAPMWPPAFESSPIRPHERLSEDQKQKLAALVGPKIPRLAFHARLDGLNPAAADRLIGEDEMAAFVQAQFAVTKTSLACDPDRTRGLEFPGQAGLVNRRIFQDLGRIDDPRPGLGQVESPTLILQPECDFVDPEVVNDYLRHLPNAIRVRIAGAGHEIQLERADAYQGEVLGFLDKALWLLRLTP